MSLTSAWSKKHSEVSGRSITDLGTDKCLVIALDGDSGNESPENLAMVFHGDIESIRRLVTRPVEIARKPVAGIPETVTRQAGVGEMAYGLRLSGLGWTEIGEKIFPGSDSGRAMATNRAKEYAKSHGKQWPIKMGGG